MTNTAMWNDAAKFETKLAEKRAAIAALTLAQKRALWIACVREMGSTTERAVRCLKATWGVGFRTKTHPVFGRVEGSVAPADYCEAILFEMMASKVGPNGKTDWEAARVARDRCYAAALSA